MRNEAVRFQQLRATTNAGRAPSEVLFRAKNGEWVFRAPNPWLIANAQHYIVNDAQKEQIIRLLI